jgi:hypothetical protein
MDFLLFGRIPRKQAQLDLSLDVEEAGSVTFSKPSPAASRSLGICTSPSMVVPTNPPARRARQHAQTEERRLDPGDRKRTQPRFLDYTLAVKGFAAIRRSTRLQSGNLW